MRTGIKQHWPSYDYTSKKIIKGGLEHMDKILEKTGRAVTPKFISILEDL